MEQPRHSSKHFLKVLWLIGMAIEHKKDNVHIEHFNTYFVSTNMSKIRKSSLLVPSAKQYAQACLSNFGNSISSTPYYSHALIDAILDRFVPLGVQLKLIYKANNSIRQKALKKQARQKKE